MRTQPNIYFITTFQSVLVSLLFQSVLVSFGDFGQFWSVLVILDCFDQL